MAPVRKFYFAYYPAPGQETALTAVITPWHDGWFPLLSEQRGLRNI